MPTVHRSPVLPRKGASSPVTSESRDRSDSVIREVPILNSARRSGGNNVDLVEASEVDLVSELHGKPSSELEKTVSDSRNVKGLRLDLAKGENRGGEGVGKESASPGLVAAAIKSLPLDAGMSLSPSLSRSNSGEDLLSICKGGPGKHVCGLEVKDGQLGLECDICQNWFHTFCQSVSRPAYNALQKHAVVAFVCTFCRAKVVKTVMSPSRCDAAVQTDVSSESVSSLALHQDESAGPVLKSTSAQTSNSGVQSSTNDIEALDNKVSDLTNTIKEQGSKIDSLQENMRLFVRSMREQESHAVEHSGMIKRVLNENLNLKMQYSEVVKKACDKVVGDVGDKLASISPLTQGQITRKEAQTVSIVFDDFLDKNKRIRNVVVHNFPEQGGATVMEKSQADIALFVSMIRDSFHLHVKATKSFRAGKVIPNKDRLLIITLENEESKFDILRMASQLRSTEEWQRVFITPDLTYKERQEQKRLRDELRRRREAGEKDLLIKRGKIVPARLLTSAPAQKAFTGHSKPKIMQHNLDQREAGQVRHTQGSRDTTSPARSKPVTVSCASSVQSAVTRDLVSPSPVCAGACQVPGELDSTPPVVLSQRRQELNANPPGPNSTTAASSSQQGQSI